MNQNVRIMPAASIALFMTITAFWVGMRVGDYGAKHVSGETMFSARGREPIAARSIVCFKDANGDEDCSITAWKARRDCELAITASIDIANRLLAKGVLRTGVEGRCTDKTIITGIGEGI